VEIRQAADVDAPFVLQVCRRALWWCCKPVDYGAASMLQAGRRGTTGGGAGADVAKMGGRPEGASGEGAKVRR
jgi:hypothetical protein